MAGIEIAPNTAYTHPAWAKDYLGREHVFPGGARLDAAQFARSNAVDVQINGTPVNEVQTLTPTGSPGGGTWKPGFRGVVAATGIAFDATKAALQASLRALSTIGGAYVTVGGTDGGPYTVTFSGVLAATDVPLITADVSGLTGGTNPNIAVVETTKGDTGAMHVGATAMTVDAISGPIPVGTVLRFNGGQLAYVTAAAVASATSLTVDPLAYEIPNDATSQWRGTGKVYVRSGTLIGRTVAERDADTNYGPAGDADDEVYLLVYDVDDALRNPDCELYRPGGLVDIVHLWSYAAASSALKTKLASTYQLMRGAD